MRSVPQMIYDELGPAERRHLLDEGDHRVLLPHCGPCVLLAHKHLCERRWYEKRRLTRIGKRVKTVVRNEGIGGG